MDVAAWPVKGREVGEGRWSLVKKIERSHEKCGSWKRILEKEKEEEAAENEIEI